MFTNKSSFQSALVLANILSFLVTFGCHFAMGVKGKNVEAMNRQRWLRRIGFQCTVQFASVWEQRSKLS